MAKTGASTTTRPPKLPAGPPIVDLQCRADRYLR